MWISYIPRCFIFNFFYFIPWKQKSRDAFLYCSVGPAKNPHFDTTKTSGTLSLARIHSSVKVQIPSTWRVYWAFAKMFSDFYTAEKLPLFYCFDNLSRQSDYCKQKTPLLQQISVKHCPRQRCFSTGGVCSLYRVVGDFRSSELTAAVSADVSVVPGDYVVWITIRASHYAALHW